MAGLDALVRGAVATASRFVGKLKVEVQHQQWVGHTVDEVKHAPAKVIRNVILELKIEDVRTSADNPVLSKHKLTFLDPPENVPGVLGRTGPIDARDVIILPGGITGPILAIEGIVDPQTQAPYLYEVWLG